MFCWMVGNFVALDLAMARHPFYSDTYFGELVKDSQNVLSEAARARLRFPRCSFEDPLNGARVICEEVYCVCVV